MSGISEFIHVRGDSFFLFVGVFVQVAFVAVFHSSSHNFSLIDSTFPAPYLASNAMRMRTRFWLASEHLARLLAFACLLFGCKLSQTCGTSRLLGSLTTRPRFFSSESEMQKIQKKTHNINSKMRNNASFQQCAPEDNRRETGALFWSQRTLARVWPKSACS